MASDSGKYIPNGFLNIWSREIDAVPRPDNDYVHLCGKWIGNRIRNMIGQPIKIPQVTDTRVANCAECGVKRCVAKQWIGR